MHETISAGIQVMAKSASHPFVPEEDLAVKIHVGGLTLVILTKSTTTNTFISLFFLIGTIKFNL